jgi:protein-S-isoprenylcysteine O-methyltransferase Ste14
MDEFRNILALVIILIMPVVITFWLVIHSMSKTWRKHHVGFAYGVAGIAIVCVLTLCWKLRKTLIGADLGINWLLFAIGLAVYLASWVLWKPVKKNLDFKTFAGIPEVTNKPIPLITNGPFAMVRHPRYFMVAVGVIGWCLMANYAGAYWFGLASIAGLYLIVALEERDLIERFGDEYREYAKRVPQLMPKLSGIKSFLKSEFGK